MTGRFIEVCCEGCADAVQAWKGGADRIELCANLDVGGTTPSREEIEKVMASCPGLAVNVLVRPRGGDFVFGKEETDTMVRDITMCRELGVNAVVIGALTPEGDADLPAMRTLIQAAKGDSPFRPLQVTFHRAIDVCRDIFRCMEDAIDLGCDRILTSGHEASAYEGRFRIAEMVERADGRIVILAGCGVRTSNIVQLERDSHAAEFHSTSHGADGHTSSETVNQLKTL